MELRFVNVIILVIFTIEIADCQITDMKEIITPSSKKYCGGNLSQALSKICQGHYNTIYKKSLALERRAHWTSLHSGDGTSEELSYPHRKKSEATSMIGMTRKRRRGVYNECCEKSCTSDELSTYCAPNNGRRRK